MGWFATGRGEDMDMDKEEKREMSGEVGFVGSGRLLN